MGTLIRHLAPDDPAGAAVVADLPGMDGVTGDDLLAAAAADPLRVLLAVRDDALVGALCGDFTAAGYRVDRLATADDDGEGAARLLEELKRIAPDGTIEIVAAPAGSAARGRVERALEAAAFERRPAKGRRSPATAFVHRPPRPPDAYASLSDLVDYLRACRFEHLVRAPGEWLQVAVRRGGTRAIVDVGWDAPRGEVLVVHYAPGVPAPPPTAPGLGRWMTSRSWPPVRFEVRMRLDPTVGVSHGELFEAVDAAVEAAAAAERERIAPAPGRDERPRLLDVPISRR